ncbi:hypothetical protein LIER_20026 [Lithospermum erythrorhizon]|uniref:Growth-regulating factor n=1 Tax=Lithospermum erythrorhizon TaxID=34254 RepID=A0AAV3QMX3_LITER
MELGEVGLEGGGGLVLSSDIEESTISSSNAETNKQKLCGSGFLKQERSGDNNQEEWRGFKMSRTDDDVSAATKTMQKNSLLFDGHQQMLSFSAPNSQAQTIPYYLSNAYGTRIPGYGNGGLNGGYTHEMVSGIRGPFTPSQWMELEHQALIYKYISANVPIPSYLLNPIRKALDSAGFSSILGLRSNALRWGAFGLGFTNNSDPEPGRCRRTDGKKWRCSRDAVTDQKYCERHINRGRHRSRKPVEGQPGHSVPRTSNGTTKLPLGSTVSATVAPSGGASNTSGLACHQTNSLLPGGINTSSTSPPFDSRNSLVSENKGKKFEDTTNFSMRYPPMILKHHYLPAKQQNPSEETLRTEFGLVCSDSLLNPLNKSSALINSRSYDAPEDLKSGGTGDKLQNQLHPFMNDWPKTRSDSSTISWSNMDVHSDRTQLSISIPVATDYMSTTSSLNNEKLGSFPLRLFSELEATSIGLGAGSVDEQKTRRANWTPGSWQTPVGGPLGEVLHSTSDLNVMTYSSNRSPLMAFSPTGVLLKAAFGSVSNSSGGSSPRTASLCNKFLGSSLHNSTSL